jgi:hypothetical protein
MDGCYTISPISLKATFLEVIQRIFYKKELPDFGVHDIRVKLGHMLV